MPEYLRPGVFLERVDASAPGIAALRTDVAGFVGIAERGPLNTPVPVQSFRQFQAHFGDFIGAGYLAYAVHAFFEGGGRRCWVVRVAAATNDQRAMSAAVVIDGTDGLPAWRIAASSPGVWGNELTVALRTQRRAQTAALPGAGDPRGAVVGSTAGFERGSLVRISQPDGAGSVREAVRVLSLVDPNEKRLCWVHPEAALRLDYDLALPDFDRNLAWTIERLSWSLAVSRRGNPAGQSFDLEAVPEADRFAPRIQSLPEYPARLAPQQGLPAPAPAVIVESLRDDGIPPPLAIEEGRSLPLSGGSDGLSALAVEDFIGEPFSPNDSDMVKAARRRGLSSLNLVDEIALVAIPDIVIQPQPEPRYQPVTRPRPDPCLKCPPPPEPLAPPNQPSLPGELPPVFSDDQVYRVQSAMIEHCVERGDRFAILDPPFNAARNDENGIAAIRAWRARFDTSYAALYYPWLVVVEPRGAEPVRPIPPSGHVAGCYARHDLETGVHRAPANTPLPWVQDVTVTVSEAMHEILNPAGIDVIRLGSARGLRVLGARTLSSDPAYVQVNVRRLLLMIREAIDVSTQWVVFEPNDHETRRKVSVALSSFLSALWQLGALTGASPAEAFFVKCDEENNPPEARADGRLLAEVGVAPAHPMEFIVLRIGRQANELEITETSVLARAA